MGASTLSNVSGSLRRIYTDERIEYAQNHASPLRAKFQETKDIRQIRPGGSGYYWPFALQSPWNVGIPAEAGNVPTTKQRTEAQGSINAGQFVGTFDISFMLEEAGDAAGGWNGGEVKRHSFETLTNATKLYNIIYAGTHGTGRLAMTAANVAGTTFTARQTVANPVGSLLLRPNMRIEAYDADTSGALQGTAKKITKVVNSTRVVTIDASLTATGNPDVHIYLESSYGQSTVANGLNNLIDDGTFATSIHGVSRSTYEELKSTVMSNSGTLRLLDEDLLVLACLEVRQRVGQSIDLLVMNTGQLAAYLRFVRPDRRYPVSGRGVPAYTTGFNSTDTLEFIYDGRKVPILVSEDVWPRRIFGITTSQMRRATLRKLGWKDWGGGNIFQQGVNSTGYMTTMQATLYGLENIGTFMPAAHFVITDLTDPHLCGTLYGGTDSF